MTGKSERIPASGSRPSLLRSSLVTLGVPVPVLIALADTCALRLCHTWSDEWQAYSAYALIVAQTGLLGALVGSQIRKQPLWWGILLWGVVLMNLQVFTLAIGHPGSPASTIGVAFVSSQAGVLICIAVLGTTAGPVRIPSAAIGLAFAGFYAVALDADDDWYTVLLFQGLATAIVCLALRSVGFRIEKVDLRPVKDRADRRMQFSIRHIFYWTTGVAIALALARLIGWQNLWSWGTHVRPDLLVVVPLLTVISILGMWGALGRESWTARLLVLFVMLPGIGAVQGGAAHRWTGRWFRNDLFSGWYLLRNASVETSIVWAVLAGVLLAGLLLVYRTSGSRLQRRTKPAATDATASLFQIKQ